MKESNNTIDCIFDINNTHTILVQRGREPFKGYWALPGGRQFYGEKLEITVVREMFEETGIKINILADKLPYPIEVLGQQTFLDQIRTYHSGKDPRGGNTTVYAILLKGCLETIGKNLKAGDDADAVKIFDLSELPELAFDHNQFLHDYYKKLKKFKNPTPTTDIIIEHHDGEKEGIILIERLNPPYGIAIPGGFAEYGLTLEENALKEGKEETGLDNITIINPEQPLCVHSHPSRDPRAHLISATYLAKGYGKLQPGIFDDAKNPQVYTNAEVEKLIEEDKLAFDHGRILEKYLKYKGYLK